MCSVQENVTFPNQMMSNMTVLSTVDCLTSTTTAGFDIVEACTLALCKNIKNTVYYLCNKTFQNIAHEIERENLYQTQVSTESKIVLSTILSVIMIASVCGNSLVVMTFILNKHMRSVTNVFILSLAVSDLLVTFTCIPMDMGAVLSTYWIFGRFGCKLMPCITQFFVAGSSLTLCCIAFDRYYAIVHPLKLKFLQTPQRATFLQVIVWTVSAAVSIPFVMFYDTLELSACKVVDDETNTVCIAQRYEATRKVFVEWVTLFVLFFGPFVFISAMYAVICYKLWIQRPIGAGSQKTHDGRLRLKRKAIKMLIIVVVIFVVCWSPLLLFNGMAEMSHVPTSMTSLMIRACLQCLSLSSTCWNPIVYAFMNENFRKAFKSLLMCNKRRVHPVSIRNNTLRMSTESKKTTSQLEYQASGSLKTTETKA